MEREKLVNKAENLAISAIYDSSTLSPSEHERLNELPDDQAIRRLALIFLLRAAHNITELPC